MSHVNINTSYILSTLSTTTTLTTIKSTNTRNLLSINLNTTNKTTSRR